MHPEEDDITTIICCHEQVTTDEAVLRERQEMDGNTR